MIIHNFCHIWHYDWKYLNKLNSYGPWKLFDFIFACSKILNLTLVTLRGDELMISQGQTQCHLKVNLITTCNFKFSSISIWANEILQNLIIFRSKNLIWRFFISVSWKWTDLLDESGRCWVNFALNKTVQIRYRAVLFELFFWSDQWPSILTQLFKSNVFAQNENIISK